MTLHTFCVEFADEYGVLKASLVHRFYKIWLVKKKRYVWFKWNYDNYKKVFPYFKGGRTFINCLDGLVKDGFLSKRVTKDGSVYYSYNPDNKYYEMYLKDIMKFV